jgi:hypothetical protein
MELFDGASGAGADEVNPKQELIRQLERRKLYELAAKVRRGHYSDFASPLTFPQTQLVMDLEAAQAPDLAARARNGDFDHER